MCLPGVQQKLGHVCGRNWEAPVALQLLYDTSRQAMVPPTTIAASPCTNRVLVPLLPA